MKLHEALQETITDEERQRYGAALPTLDTFQLGVLILLCEMVEAIKVVSDQFVRFEPVPPAPEPKRKGGKE